MTTDDIKQILHLALEYYKQEVFGKFDNEHPDEEHRAKWILDKLKTFGPNMKERDEEIALSIMFYLETHIKKEDGLVLHGVTLKDAREWIRKMINEK